MAQTYTEGSLAAAGANEPVVPASKLQEAMNALSNLGQHWDGKTLENDILKEAVDFAKAKKVDSAHAAVVGGPPMRTICSTLGVARSHIAALLNRPAN
jgi:hypothetical protein